MAHSISEINNARYIYMTFQFLTKWHFNMAHRAIKRPRKTYMHSQSEACLDLKLVNPSPSLSLRNNELFLCLGCICILPLTPSKATGRAWFIFCQEYSSLFFVFAAHCFRSNSQQTFVKSFLVKVFISSLLLTGKFSLRFSSFG